MKKLVIWLLSATILAVLIAAGFFYYQSNKPKNPSNSNINTLTNQLGGFTFENTSEEKLPSNVQLKDTVIEYPLKIKPLSDKTILKITNTEIINKGKKR